MREGKKIGKLLEIRTGIFKSIHEYSVTFHEAVVPDLHEACGQHMLEKAPDELDGIECDFSTAIAAFLAIGEGDSSIFDNTGHPKRMSV